MIAASHTSGAATQMWTPTAPVPTNMPSVNSRESPGRKKPTSRPVSAKITSMTPTIAQGPNHSTIVVIMLAASSHLGPRVGARAPGRSEGRAAGSPAVTAVARGITGSG
jgi:hypothetical protein